MENPEQLIQSQLVKITGTEKDVRRVLQILKIWADHYEVTVTVLPSSVQAEEHGVTAGVPKNPRQDGEA